MATATVTEATDIWAGLCRDCAHPTHEMTCHELVSNGDPSNGPAYCPCAVNMELMEQEIVRLRAERAAMVAKIGELSSHLVAPRGRGRLAQRMVNRDAVIEIVR